MRIYYKPTCSCWQKTPYKNLCGQPDSGEQTYISVESIERWKTPFEKITHHKLWNDGHLFCPKCGEKATQQTEND